ncbi:MAG: hypothetical protein M3O70_12565 [Actinomycetota bacterium]|nr:hypothetical protein [Actinomycetota bacterium]
MFAANGTGDNAGIRLMGVSGVTVRNGTVTGFDAGVVIGGGSSKTVRKIVASDTIALVAGGATFPPAFRPRSAELYNPAIGEWTAAAEMNDEHGSSARWQTPIGQWCCRATPGGSRPGRRRAPRTAGRCWCRATAPPEQSSSTRPPARRCFPVHRSSCRACGTDLGPGGRGHPGRRANRARRSGSGPREEPTAPRLRPREGDRRS